MDEEKRLSYFFLGMGIGVAAGMLFAPKTGEDTRLMLKLKADESKDYLKRTTAPIMDQAADLVDRSKTVLQRQKEQLAAAVDAGKQAYRETTAQPPQGTTGFAE